MAELIPAPFSDLVARLYLEPARQQSVFGLAARNWFVPTEETPDFSVRFHGHRAGTPFGPAAGPHTQMAQNLALAYLGGGRIMELKTVQVNDRLEIPRPCIDMANVGYNVEWSQELLIEQSLREYVAGMMLTEMLRRGGAAEAAAPGFGQAMAGPAGDFIFDISVGYNLEGIRSAKIQGFLDGLRDASALIEQLRGEIPAPFKAARELEYPARIADSLTLSTFHGCPADEIERICEFLIAERELNVVVKMNPPMLGKERLDHLLHDVMGYTEITVNPAAYTNGLQFDEAAEMARRLTAFGAARGRTVGFKFSNTLEVQNHRQVFTPENKLMYLSGPPLHVITLTLAEAFRQAVGPFTPITFSAGVDAGNAAATVACGLKPVSVSSDLLKPGGYGRFATYLKNLGAEMVKAGAASVDEFILKAFGREAEARAGLEQALAQWPRPEGSNLEDDALVMFAGWLNTPLAAEAARSDPRYRAAANRKEPKRVETRLATFDCLTCNKCIPVCPNAANFSYPTAKTEFEIRDLTLRPGGETEPAGPARVFRIAKDWQIGNYGDFCNECGNCDTFCPEQGGPYIEKPTLYGSEAAWLAAAPRDGFCLAPQTGGRAALRGRWRGKNYTLILAGDERIFDDESVKVRFNAQHQLIAIDSAALAEPHTVEMEVYHNFYSLLTGLLDARHVTQVNAAWLSATGTAAAPTGAA